MVSVVVGPYSTSNPFAIDPSSFSCGFVEGTKTSENIPAKEEKATTCCQGQYQYEVDAEGVPSVGAAHDSLRLVLLR